MNENLQRELEKILPAVQTPKPTEVAAQTETREDFEYARKNIKDIMDTGKKALDEILDIATTSQHPRAFEVVAGLIQTMVDANKSLLDLHKKTKDITGISDNSAPGGAVNVKNAVFVGSTKELQEIMRGKKELPNE